MNDLFDDYLFINNMFLQNMQNQNLLNQVEFQREMDFEQMESYLISHADDDQKMDKKKRDPMNHKKVNWAE